MVDIKYPTSGNIKVWWVPSNGFANWKAPTAAEINAGIDITDAISWNDKDFGSQASNTVNDPAISAVGNVQTRGAAQYGGSFSLYYPKIFNDNTNKYSLVFDALRLPGTTGYIVTRVDGVMLSTTSGTASQPGTQAAAGDYVNIFLAETAGYTEVIVGEEAFRFTVSFLPKGRIQTFGVVRANSTPVAPTVAGASALTVAAKYTVLTAQLVSREYSRGVVWATSTPNFASISANGVVTAIAAGTASFTATDPATNTASTAKTITIT